MSRKTELYLFCSIFLLLQSCLAQDLTGTQAEVTYSHADTLRGSNTPQRAWWDVVFYDLNVHVNPKNKTIKGSNVITYRVNQPPYTVNESPELQIDLMQPLRVDSVISQGNHLNFKREGNAYFISAQHKQIKDSLYKIKVFYHGSPHVAKNPPWNGGFIWQKDEQGNDWIATAVQGLGASAWWPNKDYQGDEPDSQRISVTVPDPLMDISNGKLRSTKVHENGTRTYEWFVDNPINNYLVALNIGVFSHIKDTFPGLLGTLSLDYYVLPENKQKAIDQFKQVKTMLHCFEDWFGPYPWYKDGYKLVETPYLGMENQSAIGYGNKYQNGYRGIDLSHSGEGMKWDFIIIHESAHEWWGNNITTADIADMWVHEAFANYAEALYTECLYGKEAGDIYCIGNRQNVVNDRPIIGNYGVNSEGSGDMYYKGGNMLLTIRSILQDDALFKEILQGLNRDFRHQIVTGRQIQQYINKKSGYNFDQVFKQYLETTLIPKFRYFIKKGVLHYKWENVIPNFAMPLRVMVDQERMDFIYPTEEWKTQAIAIKRTKDFKIDPNFYVEVELKP